MSAAPDVFLSYNREDLVTARRIANGLEGNGLSVWWDTALSPGEAYDLVTERALREARAVVVLWSRRSVESRWVRAEATLADRNGTLVPAMIEACERPIMFELTQTADLTKWSGDSNDAIWRAFIAGVRRFTERSAPSASPIKTEVRIENGPVGLSGASSPDLPILAVLAFENQSSDPELQFFSDGVAEEIFNAMTRVSGIRVIGSTSSFSFRGEKKKDAARMLNATHVLDGSVRRGGARVRITAHVTETASGHVLWSERYDRELADAFAVQDEIAGETAKALEAKLAPPKPKAQIDPQAYDLYLRAMAIRKSPDWPAQRKAIAYLKAAVEIEPGFARAQAALAFTSCQLIVEATVEGARPEAFDEAVAAVRREAARALELDPADPEARLTLHTVEPVVDNWRAHEASYEAASQAAPNDLVILFRRARWLVSVGRNREGQALLAQGYEIDPLSPTWMCAKAMSGVDEDAAYALHQKAVALSPLDAFVWRRTFINASYGGHWDNALEMVNGERPVPSAISPTRLSLYAQFVALWRVQLNEVERAWKEANGEQPLPPSAWTRIDLAGRHRGVLLASRDLLNSFRETAEAQVRRWPFTVASVTTLMRSLGLVDEALDLLDETMKATPPDRLWSQWNAEGVVGAGTEILFSATSPRMLRLCARLGLCSYWAETNRWPDFIVDAPNRAELEGEVKRLVTPSE
jgi:TolB-like protein